MKTWWKSRTVWFNAIAAMLAVLEGASGLLLKHLGPEGYLIASMLFAGVNVVLRFVTTQSVK
jgi:hypothetical protein